MEPNGTIGNHHGSDSDANKLFLRAQELDKELKLLLKKKTIFDKNVVTIRNNLKECYEKLIINHYEFASTKEIEQNLWKIVFYKIIEEYRKKIRTNMQKTEKTDPAAKDDFGRLCESFRSFLHAANKFYNELIKKLQEKYHLRLDGTEYPLKGFKDETVRLHKSYYSCHRCLIFLGDLARYHRDLVNHPSQKDWTKASRFYKQALKLIPDNGNPHNQLAVLATYVDDEFGAVYHYFLSLGCTHPFLTAKDNLQVLFEKNRQKFSEGNESAEPNHPHFSNEVKRFLSRFVRLHGMLFTKTSLDKFEDWEAEILKEADNLFQKNELTEDSILNMTVINTFAVYNIHHMSESGQGATYAEISQKSLLIKFSISFALRLFALILKTSYSGEPKHLAAITVFLDFLKLNSDFLKKPDDRDSATWNLIWKEFAKLLTVIGPPETNVSFVQDFPAIKEELQLRGFVPFQQLYRVLPYPTSEIPDEVAKLKRMNKVRDFGTFAMNQLPKVPLYFDAESGVYSDRPVIKVKSPQPNGMITPTMIENTPRASPAVQEFPSPSKMEDGETFKDIEERLGLEELVDDVDDEVILFKPGEGDKHHEHEGDYHSKSIIGSGRVERSTSSDKMGSLSPRNTNGNGFDLFGNNGNSNQSFFSFSNLFGHQPQPQQPQPQPQPQPQAQPQNSFFGNAFMNNYTSPNGTPMHPQQNPYMYQQTSPSFANNSNNENGAFGNSYWSPTAPNSFFPSPQGDKIPNYGQLSNGQNPFLTPQSQAPSPQVVSPYGPTTPMTWLTPPMQQTERLPSPNQKINDLNSGNFHSPQQQPQQLPQQSQQHSPHLSVAPPPGFQPLNSGNAQNLPFPFPGSNQPTRGGYKSKNPFGS